MYSRVVEHLLTNNANASKRDKKGFTAIHYASVKGNKLSIEMVSVSTVYPWIGHYHFTCRRLQTGSRKLVFQIKFTIRERFRNFIMNPGRASSIFNKAGYSFRDHKSLTKNFPLIFCLTVKTTVTRNMLRVCFVLVIRSLFCRHF